jgi:hypothetical protein
MQNNSLNAAKVAETTPVPAITPVPVIDPASTTPAQVNATELGIDPAK